MLSLGRLELSSTLDVTFEKGRRRSRNSAEGFGLSPNHSVFPIVSDAIPARLPR